MEQIEENKILKELITYALLKEDASKGRALILTICPNYIWITCYNNNKIIHEINNIQFEGMHENKDVKELMIQLKEIYNDR